MDVKMMMMNVCSMLDIARLWTSILLKIFPGCVLFTLYKIELVGSTAKVM